MSLMTIPTRKRKRRARPSPGIVYVPLSDVRPSPENDSLYHPVNGDDPAFVELVASVRTSGVLQALEITADGWIVSGHRRYAAAKLAGLPVIPCIRLAERKAGMSADAFVKLLREHNRQRVKTFDERVREEIVSVDTTAAYLHLREYRRREFDHDRIRGVGVEIGACRDRAEISPAKFPMLRAVEKVLRDCRDFWPLSDRQVHYRLLNYLPLIHASKPGSVYANNLASYRALTDLLTRARLAGLISWDAIADETRPFTSWQTWAESGAFVKGQCDEFLKGYWRDLMQSQPAHVEIIAEKLTIKTIVERVAQDYTIPVTVGRGYCSIQPRYALAERYRKSGRGKLVLLLLSDFDPDGEGIAQSFTRSLRDDFGIDETCIHAVKVALNAEQVKRFELPPSMRAKESSSRFKSFEDRHGRNAWELEALPPDTLADELRKSIDGVIDREAFEHEREKESADARQLEATRLAVKNALPGLMDGE